MSMKKQMTTQMKQIRQSRQLLSVGSTGWVLLLVLLVYSLGFLSFSKAEVASSITNCPTGVTGLCTPGVFESSTETVTETTDTDATGTTTTTTTTTETTETTITNEETGDLLTDTKVNSMGRNQKFGGDMTSDWGGQGPAGIRSGSTCGDLGTDKCAELTGSGNFTSTLGQSGVGTTYKQIIDMTHSSINPSIDRGGQVAWSIRVEKRDASDSLHFRVAKTDGTTAVLLGSQTLSAAGADVITNTLFQGNFNFSGAITTKLTVEVSGRDINLAIGPLFDDVTVNVLYNVVNTIVTETITTIEQFVALEIFNQETIDVAIDIFDNNNVVQNDLGEVTLEPIGPEPQGPEPSYESVEIEMNTEISTPDIKVEMKLPDAPTQEVQVEVAEVSAEIETEMQNNSLNDMASDQPAEPTESAQNTSDTEPEPEPEPAPEPTETDDSDTQEPSSSTDKDSEPDSEAEPKVTKSSDSQKPKEIKTKQKASKAKQKANKAKQKAASKIVKKMGDKGKYDSTNQLKTLVVMQVLGNTKTFFDTQKTIPQPTGFFTDKKMPDSQLPENNAAAWLLIKGNNQLHDKLIGSQYR